MIIPFVDYASSSMMAKYEAELYMRIYQYAAEDFRTNKDCMTAHQGVTKWVTGIEQRLVQFGVSFDTHTHMVPQAPAGTLPSMLPVKPAAVKPDIPPVPPISTAGVPENLISMAIPSFNLSYINLSLKGSYAPVITKRRLPEIPSLLVFKTIVKLIKM